MAADKKTREVQFTLNDEDFKMFGRYRILYTDQGRKLVWRQRLTYLISAIAIAALFSVFHVDKGFTILAYIVAAAMAAYKDVKLVDLTDQAIYTWLSDIMIMPIPLHAFKDLKEMKAFCKWFRERVTECGGKVS